MSTGTFNISTTASVGVVIATTVYSLLSAVPLQPVTTAPLVAVSVESLHKTINTKMSGPTLRALAANDPQTLVLCIKTMSFSPGLLARAAEALGLVQEHDVAVPVLVELLYHHEAVVQEGAIYGLAAHKTEIARKSLEHVARSSSAHPLIREIAQEALDEA